MYRRHLYTVYIVTNPNRTVLYVGVTNCLPVRLAEHYFNRGTKKSFAGKFYCYNLIYYEDFGDIYEAIAREKEIKSWTRAKKVGLVNLKNRSWTFLNKKICGTWPPTERPNRY